MFDLSDKIPELKAVTSIVVTGGGPSLKKHLTIITKQIQTADTCLFDVNGYYAMMAREQIADHPLPKVLFMMDFGLDGIDMSQANRDRLMNFSQLKNVWVVLREGATAQVKWPDIQIRKILTPVVHTAKAAINGCTHGKMGTLGIALSCIPNHIVDIHMYGVDNLLYGVKTNIENNKDQKAYDKFREQLVPFIAGIAKSKNIHLHG